MTAFENNCPINVRTGDGKNCPKHGDVSVPLKTYRETGKLTPEPTTEQTEGK